MGILFKTILLSAMMIVLCALPLFFTQVKKASRLLFLIGTGALIGICFLDLLPDVLEIGGYSNLVVVFGVWVVYSAFHFIHYRRHHHHEDHHHEEHLHAGTQGVGVFLVSMIIHCLASGMMLAISTRFNADFSEAIFLALIAHKGYESLIVATVILERIPRRSRAIAAIVVYALSLPLGVLIAFLFREQINEKFALLTTSVALGTLLGCMIFDFVLPSIVHLKKQKFEAGWIILGLALTELMMKTHSG